MKTELIINQQKKIIAILLFAVCFFPYGVYAWGENKPTAIIVDDETGKPIEGAVALAQWIKPNKKATWMGGDRWKIDNAVEVFSGKEGKVYIPGFWGIYIFSKKPRLTVYKPSYVVWDSQEICTRDNEKRKGFKKKNNVIRLKKFDKEYPKWLKEFPYIKYPNMQHKGFLSRCIRGRQLYEKYGREKIRIKDIFLEYNKEHLNKETIKERSNNIN